MNKTNYAEIYNAEIPEQGVIVLPNGRILAVLDISADELAYIPANVYTVVGELCEGNFSQPAKNALASLLPIFKGLLLNERQINRAFAETSSHI